MWPHDANANQGIDDVSPVWLKKLKSINSPKVKRGKVNIFDIKNYDPTSYHVIKESLPYMKDQNQRIDFGQRMLCPKRITTCLYLPDSLDNDEIDDIVTQNKLKIGIDVIVSKNNHHGLIASKHGISFIDAAAQPKRNLLEKVKTVTGADDAIVDGSVVFGIITAAATSTDSNYNGLNANDVDVTTTDNDTAGIQ